MPSGKGTYGSKRGRPKKETSYENGSEFIIKNHQIKEGNLRNNAVYRGWLTKIN